MCNKARLKAIYAVPEPLRDSLVAAIHFSFAGSFDVPFVISAVLAVSARFSMVVDRYGLLFRSHPVPGLRGVASASSGARAQMQLVPRLDEECGSH